jgi:hypothetical protein
VEQVSQSDDQPDHPMDQDEQAGKGAGLDGEQLHEAREGAAEEGTSTASEWISAAEALKLIEHSRGGRAAAKALLAELLSDGDLTARAAKAWYSDQPTVDRAWSNRHQVEHEESHVLRPRDWRRSRDWIADTALWRWPKSRFLITLSKSPPRRRFFEGVEFQRSQIEELLSSAGKKDATTLASPPPAPAGGRVSDQARWNEFWRILLSMSQAGKLNRREYPSQTKLRKEIRERARFKDLAFSDDHIKDRVREVWKEFLGT